MKQQNMTNTRNLALDGMLTAILVVLGMIKIPSLIPGAEFQLSAPYAVCVAALVGFGRYLGIGICASIIQLLLGNHTILNVLIAMVFRIVVGVIVSVLPKSRAALYVAGPCGTAVARIVLGVVLHTSPWPLLAAALPGMIFTAVVVIMMTPVVKRVAVLCGLAVPASMVKMSGAQLDADVLKE